MNALELADELDKYKGIATRDAATMLRQQQAEIEALRNQLWDLKSEPWGFDRHPVKELTDEKILSVIKFIAEDVSPHKEYENTYSDGWLDACNTVYDEIFAILRKAQDERK